MKILFICTANVCRSALAEGYMQFLLKQNPIQDVEVSSAGVVALVSSKAFSCASEAATQSGFDLSDHRARQLTTSVADQADLILCMELWQANKVVEMNPSLIDKVRLLGKYHPCGQKLFQIRDPREFTLEETLVTFADIKQSVDVLYRSLALEAEPRRTGSEGRAINK